MDRMQIIAEQMSVEEIRCRQFWIYANGYYCYEFGDI